MTQEQEISLLEKLKEEHCEYYYPCGDSSKEKIHYKDCPICENSQAIDDIAEKFAHHKCEEKDKTIMVLVEMLQKVVNIYNPPKAFRYYHEEAQELLKQLNQEK